MEPELSGTGVAEQLNGRYVIERLVGRGGMGEVFAGRAIGVEGFTRPVAIKRLHTQYSDERVLRSMLVEEARCTASLSHGNIVSVLDLDRDEAGRLFLVMELVDGIDLASLLCTGTLPLPVALFVTCEILRGLGHAHGAPAAGGLVHRDVSPQNMLIGWDGAVKVSDFGLAKAHSGTKASASLFVKGKIAYMSPEQANGAALDGRSDLFSVGVMLWEMLCGARLFGHSTLEATVRSVLLEPIPPPRSRAPELPEDVEWITMRLLDRDRDRRFPTASAAIEALLACAAYPKDGRERLAGLLRQRLPARTRQPASEEAITLEPPVAPLLVVPDQPYPDPPRRRRGRWAALAAGVIAAAGLAALVATTCAVPGLGAGGEAGAPVVPAARVAPSAEPRAAPPPVAPAPAVSEGHDARAAAEASQARPPRAPPGRAPAKGRRVPAPELETASDGGIRVLDLRELTPGAPVTPDRKDPPAKRGREAEQPRQPRQPRPQ